MNSQQELIEAINTISEDKNKAFDTPATVLRVEGDTVWVHIDGGADETPVQKTINAEEGETVQVRISNGSAFLVGNASAPPTDDTTANEARFVAEEADEKATEAVESVNAISQTVQGKVSSGDSNITVLSSTLYQNENGVNIFNDTLAAGDSYAHIDGDEFCIREVTSAGVIDDTNDVILASFGADEVSIGYIDEEDGGYQLHLSTNGIELMNETHSPYRRRGWVINTSAIGYQGAGGVAYPSAEFSTTRLHLAAPRTSGIQASTIEYGTATFTRNRGDTAGTTEIDGGIITISGNVKDSDGNNKTPTILVSETIAAADTSYTFEHVDITADSTIDIYDTIFGFAPTNAVTIDGECTITFPAQSSTHQIKLFVY